VIQERTTSSPPTS